VDNEDMKKSLIFFSIIFGACFLAAVCAAAQTAPGDELISLNFEERPLGEVLAMITKITGHAFIIDAQWLDMPVSISTQAAPLHKVLKYIFTDINNAIIYKSDGSIKIIVYSEIPEKDKESESQETASPEESASPPATEQESESSQEAAHENETDNSVDSAEEGGTQPAAEQQSADAKPDDTAAGTTEEQSESTEGITN
jgi:type II secretory pathway component GspD/PulD (secretin)